LELIDTHCHLEEIENLRAVIDRAKSTGLIGIIAVGSDYQSNGQILEITEKYKGFVYPALGFHPAMLNTSRIDRNLEFIEEHIAEAKGIGEIGLDYHKKIIAMAPKELQKSVLREILVIARKHRKPMIIHCRYAWRDALSLVEEAGMEKAVFHWYTGPSSILRDIVSLGYYISATPAAEYHQEHRRAVKAVSQEHLLIETDSPVSYGTELRWQV
jgi:TatD DNase family protein